MFKKIIVGLISAVLVGCQMTPPVTTIETVNTTPKGKELISKLLTPPFQEISAPPITTNYTDVDTDDIVLYKYTDDLNWYLFYLFGYASIVNSFAIDKGYTPPDTPPICKVVKWPKFEEIPRFEYSADTTLESIEMELMLYINALKEQYEAQESRFNDAELTQRKLCIY